MANLSYVNVFARDVRKLSKFYMDVFEFEEEKSFRSPIFRGIRTPKTHIGFNALEAYELLGLDKHANPKGIKFLLNFDARSMKEVDQLVAKAKKRGATLIKKPYKTYYNWYQAVLLDPEGNCFRINKVLGGTWKATDWDK